MKVSAPKVHRFQGQLAGVLIRLPRVFGRGEGLFVRACWVRQINWELKFTKSTIYSRRNTHGDGESNRWRQAESGHYRRRFRRVVRRQSAGQSTGRRDDD